MTDKRLEKLCHNLVAYSCGVKDGDRVLIDVSGCPSLVAQQLVEEVYAAGAKPYTNLTSQAVKRAWLMGADEEQLRDLTRWDAERMQDMQAYIAFDGDINATELSDVPVEKMVAYRSIYAKKVYQEILEKNANWVILAWPTPAMAQRAGMSTEAFEDFYFDVCNLDYEKMSRAMDPLKDLLDNADRVRIEGPGTDLSFSIRGIGSVKCDGHYNVPDGEVYTAPVKDSVKGIISYNTPSFYQGFGFENVVLEFENGRIVKAIANDIDRLNGILDTDEGARYVGEFSFGLNPRIHKAMGDILFDEKIAGSLHLTPGASYDDAPNGNKSAVHWDLVLVQTPEMGGGKIYVDDVLVREDGVFVPKALQGLNPENLA